MTDDFVADRARSWLRDGPTAAPRHAIDGALEGIASLPQDRQRWWPSRLLEPSGGARLHWAFFAAVLAVAVAFVALRPAAPIALPGASAAARPSPTPPASPRPSLGSDVGVIVPDRSFRPYEGTSAAWMADVAACLRDKGWDATIEWDGGMHVTVGPSRQAQFSADEFECWDIFGGPRPYVPPTDAEIRAIYDYWAHGLRDCLIGMGYAIGEPPTEQEFVDTYPRTEGIVESGPWSPYLELPENLGAHSWREVNETCPQAPPG